MAENLLDSEPLVVYDRALIHLHSDRRAETLLELLSAAQARVRNDQSNGGVIHEDIDNLRSLQNEAQRNQTILEYVRAQQAVKNYLREINQEISQLLGVDFATLAGRSSC